MNPREKCLGLSPKAELSLLEMHDLKQVSFEDYMDGEDPPARRFMAAYVKKIVKCPTTESNATSG